MLRRSYTSFFISSHILLQSSSVATNNIDPLHQPNVEYATESIARERVKNLPTPVDMTAAFYVEGNSVNTLDDIKAAGCTQVVLIGHGLLGSARNWNGTARKIGWKLPKSCGIVALDLRNHGYSPHAPIHSADAMSSDIEHFAKKIEKTFGSQLKSIGLIGHSMAGVATTNTLSMNTFDPTALPTLAKYLKAAIVVDVCPDVRPKDAFRNIEEAFHGMQTIDFTQQTNFGLAEKQLKKTISDPTMRSFLLTNFVAQSTNEPTARWRCNFPVLCQVTLSKSLFFSTSPILHDTKKQRIQVPTFFVFGADSPYNTQEGRARIPELFEDERQIALPDAGHYVHVQKQDEFATLTCDWFLEKMI